MEMKRGDLIMVDTNVLLSASNKARPDHEASLRVFSRTLEQGIHAAVCGQILREYLVAATRPTEGNGLGMTANEALKNVAWFRSRLVYFEEPEAVHYELCALIEASGVSGKRIHDANIVALMRYAGIKAIITNNADDFRSFGNITVIEPSAL